MITVPFPPAFLPPEVANALYPATWWLVDHCNIVASPETIALAIAAVVAAIATSLVIDIITLRDIRQQFTSDRTNAKYRNTNLTAGS